LDNLTTFLDAVGPVPDPLVDSACGRIETAAQWTAGRAGWLERILTEVYGRPPAAQMPRARSRGGMNLPNLPGRLEMVQLALVDHPDLPVTISLALCDQPGPRPTVILTQDLRNFQGVSVHPFTPIALEAGFHLVTYSLWQVEPDEPGAAGWRGRFPDCDWGTLCCWAWSVSRVVDYLLARDDVDRDGLVITGHSRRGKTSLLAAAMDERIGYCAPNASGLFGLDLTRGHYHPDCDRRRLPGVLDEFPHWFCPAVERYRHDVPALPFDQHHLLALVAPRPVITTQALDDEYTWVPAAEATFELARPIYDLFDAGDGLAMHTRPGRHAHTPEEFRWMVDQVARRHARQ